MVIAEYRSGVNRGDRKAVVLVHKNESNNSLHFPWRENEVLALGRAGAMKFVTWDEERLGGLEAFEKDVICPGRFPVLFERRYLVGQVA